MRFIMNGAFTIIFFTGFMLALGTAGISDMEVEAHRRIISDSQFLIQSLLSFALMLFGGCGNRILNKLKGRIHRGRIHLYKVKNYETIGNTYHRTGKTTHEKPENRNFG